jgi:hypothetical protein
LLVEQADGHLLVDDVVFGQKDSEGSALAEGGRGLRGSGFSGLDRGGKGGTEGFPEGTATDGFETAATTFAGRLGRSFSRNP